MAFSAKVHERSFERWLYTGDLTPINIGFFLFPSAGLDIQIVQALSIYQCDPQLFRLGRVN